MYMIYINSVFALTCGMKHFPEITYRFQSARPEVRQLLLQYLLPWLHNMELVDPNIPPSNAHMYQVCTN